MGSVQSAGAGEFLVDSSKGRGDVCTGDQTELSRGHDSDAAATEAAQTRSYWLWCQTETS